jgi:hypothetical protein
MRMKKAQRLRTAWRNKPCNHPDYDRENYRGADTGDKVCTQCGQELSDEEVEKIRKKKQV